MTRLKTLNFIKGMGPLRRAKEEKITSGSLIYISPSSNRDERITNLKKQKQIIVKQQTHRHQKTTFSPQSQSKV